MFFLSRIGSRLGLGLSVFLLVPLMIIEIVSHLSNCLRSRCLILNGNHRHSRIYVKLYMISLQNILIFFVYLYHFVTNNTWIILTFDCSRFLINIFQLFLNPILFLAIHFRVKYFYIMFLFWRFWSWRCWCWRIRLGSNFYISWRKITLDLWAF